jgi:hypothetical protein
VVDLFFRCGTFATNHRQPPIVRKLKTSDQTTLIPMQYKPLHS